MSEEIAIAGLIVVEQLPIISEQLKAHSAGIDEKLAIVEALVCTEETVKEVKKIRAEFNKDFAVIEELRKRVKNAVLAPYQDFELVYKTCVSDKYNAADATLKAKITDVENELKTKKMSELKTYFDEYAASKNVSGYADFERQMSDQRASQTFPALMRICRERIDQLASGLAAIDAQPEDIRAEILAEFKKTLSATEAIAIIAQRHRDTEEQEIAKKEREQRQAAEAEAAKRVDEALPDPMSPPRIPIAPPVAAPTEDPDPVRCLSFKVTAPLSKLRELKRFLDEGEYEYE